MAMELQSVLLQILLNVVFVAAFVEMDILVVGDGVACDGEYTCDVVGSHV